MRMKMEKMMTRRTVMRREMKAMNPMRKDRNWR